MKTIAEAEAEGFTVDLYAAGRPLAYKGARFGPTARESLLTELEAELLTAYREVFAELERHLRSEWEGTSQYRSMMADLQKHRDLIARVTA